MNLAFALVLLAAYFFTFSTITSLSTTQIAVLIGAGMAYLGLGIYGYGYCAQHSSQVAKALYFISQLILGGIIIYLTKGAGLNLLILLPLAGQSVVILPTSWAYLVNIVIMLTYIIANGSVFTGFENAWSGLATFITGQIFIVVFTQTVVGEEKARLEVERLVRELETANQQLRAYAIQVEDLAVTKERSRVSREIHDGLGHYLTTIFMQIQAARAVMDLDTKKAAALLVTAQQLSQEALLDVRQSIAEMRSGYVESEPLLDRINSLLAISKSENVLIKFSIKGAARQLSPQRELAIFRAVQEGVNNIRKHSQAANAWIELDYSDAKNVRLIVRDDGIGSETLAGGFGLLGLQERVHLLNGSVSFESHLGSGFSFEVILPDETID